MRRPSGLVSSARRKHRSHIMSAILRDLCCPTRRSAHRGQSRIGQCTCDVHRDAECCWGCSEARGCPSGGEPRPQQLAARASGRGRPVVASLSKRAPRMVSPAAGWSAPSACVRPTQPSGATPPALRTAPPVVPTVAHVGPAKRTRPWGAAAGGGKRRRPSSAPSRMSGGGGCSANVPVSSGGPLSVTAAFLARAELGLEA